MPVAAKAAGNPPELHFFFMSSNGVSPADLDEIERILGINSETEREVRGRLLEKTLDATGGFLALASHMGSARNGAARRIPSYAASHSLEWIAQNVLLGSEMPFMHGHIDSDSGRLYIDVSIADEVKQRAPDWTRQPALAAYLARPERKFGPIIAVVQPSWVDDPHHENWDADGRAQQDAISFDPVEPSGRVGRIELEDAKLFALDGQHRVLGIRGLRDIRDLGFLELRTRDGQAKSATITREQFQEEFEMEISELQRVLNDSLVIEYLPSVVKGETRTEGNRRVRAVFIAINSYAKRTDKGENILLDENDGFSIVARRIAVSHPLFQLTDGTSSVDFKRTSIPAVGNQYLTTLQSIRSVVQTYLRAAQPKLVRNWESRIRGAVAVRPSEDVIYVAEKEAKSFFDLFAELPIFNELRDLDVQDFRSELSRWRDFYKVNQRGEVIEASRINRGHLLLRPLGQEILARAVGELVASHKDGGRGWTVESAFSALDALDHGRQFESHRPSSPWYGITYSVDGGRIITRNSSWAHQLLVHLIDGTPSDGVDGLALRVKQARTINRQTGEWMTLTGRVSRREDLDNILP